MWAKLDRDIDWESNNVKFLGITLDNNPKFGKHVSNDCMLLSCHVRISE